MTLKYSNQSNKKPFKISDLNYKNPTVVDVINREHLYEKIRMSSADVETEEFEPIQYVHSTGADPLTYKQISNTMSDLKENPIPFPEISTLEFKNKIDSYIMKKLYSGANNPENHDKVIINPDGNVLSEENNLSTLKFLYNQNIPDLIDKGKNLFIIVHPLDIKLFAEFEGTNIDYVRVYNPICGCPRYDKIPLYQSTGMQNREILLIDANAINITYLNSSPQIVEYTEENKIYIKIEMKVRLEILNSHAVYIFDIFQGSCQDMPFT